MSLYVPNSYAIGYTSNTEDVKASLEFILFIKYDTMAPG